jgi:hypothetical protein
MSDLCPLRIERPAGCIQLAASAEGTYTKADIGEYLVRVSGGLRVVAALTGKDRRE